MHLIQRRLNEIRSRKLIWNQAWIDKKNPYVGHIYQIQFDAWTYAKADLWASLMQTIFYEFNRQLALEKQIAEALVGVNHRFGHSGRTACLLNKV